MRTLGGEGLTSLLQNADGAALYHQAVLAEEGHGQGQQLPLALLHDPPLQYLRRIVGQDLHRLLQDDGSPVALRANEVDGGPGQLDACLLYTSPSPRDGATSRMPSSA